MRSIKCKRVSGLSNLEDVIVPKKVFDKQSGGRRLRGRLDKVKSDLRQLGVRRWRPPGTRQGRVETEVLQGPKRYGMNKQQTLRPHGYKQLLYTYSQNSINKIQKVLVLMFNSDTMKV